MLKNCFTRIFPLLVLLLASLACNLAIDFNPPPIVTQLPAGNPTKTPVVVTALPPTATIPAVPFPALSQVNMLKAGAGWGSDESGRLYRSTDGGLTWLDRSPQNVTTGLWGNAFLDADHAWLLITAADSPLQILRTSDGGQTWQSLSPDGLGANGMPFLHFTTPNDGLAEVAGVGAGNLYMQVFETHDGGANWTVVPLLPFRKNEELPTGTLHLCSICGDTFYHDAARTLVVEGDMGSMATRNTVHLYSSTDLGQNWSEQNLPLPTQYGDALVSPLGLHFVSPVDGFLPVRLVKYNTDGATAYDIFALYVTRDGGATWNLTPTALEKAASNSFQYFLSATDVILQCGPALCVTRDAAQTWQTVTPNIDLASTDTRWVSQMQFVDLNTGWLILNEAGKYQIYGTTDGGVTWNLLTH